MGGWGIFTAATTITAHSRGVAQVFEENLRIKFPFRVCKDLAARFLLLRAGVSRQTVCKVSGSVYSQRAARWLDSQASRGSWAVRQSGQSGQSGQCQAVDVGFRPLTVAALVFQFLLTPKRCKTIEKLDQ